MTRMLIAVFAFGFGALMLSSAQVKADAPKVPKDTCVKPCQDCAAECLHCMKHCLEKNMPQEARQCEICHHLCLACAGAVSSKNGRAWDICELCEKECLDCAAVCEKGDEHMKKCAKACRDCAVACAAARK